MELGLAVATVIVFAVLLATIAGLGAARMLMRAAEAGSPEHGSADPPSVRARGR
jgi:hypothetical protein